MVCGTRAGAKSNKARVDLWPNGERVGYLAGHNLGLGAWRRIPSLSDNRITGPD